MEKHYYGTGRVRALEARMLSGAQVARMAAADDFEGAFSVLSETIYAQSLSRLKQAFDLEELCRLEKEELKLLLERLAPQNEVLNALFAEDLAGLKRVCEKIPSPILKELAAARLDLANLKLLLRFQLLKRDRDSFARALLSTGHIDRDVLLGLFDKSVPEMAGRLYSTPYFPFLAEGMEFLAKEGSFYLLEKLMDDYLIGRIKKAKYLTCGIEPLVGFYLAKLSEIRGVRFILICKKNRVDPERIQHRLRASYV